jgi:outer membrane lipoprotein SlyB
MEKSKTQVVYQVSVRYDDGTWTTLRQASPMGLHVGDRVVVTDRGIELLQRCTRDGGTTMNRAIGVKRKTRIAGTASALVFASLLAMSAAAQTYSVSSARPATIESIREVVQQNSNPSGLGLIAGGLVGGGLGSLIGSGTGRTVATIVGAVGGGYVGHNLEKSKTHVIYEIAVRYDDRTWGTIKQSGAPQFKVGDRVLVTDQGLEPLP